ncbi:HK97 gp10 family phage protein [Rouxiella badensis]|uniref:HK97 gp10 family phage protein n=1 Tax=Rouxiella silvae TaxID=1646373 RepID=A0AA40X3A5_9GAMM|nr:MULTISPECIES: HK97-gp10 family putative phage morphogenesis protein [Rouxiella]MBF6637901.1 HK97 gp10 family phage protein [Rouxiella silvae]MCC3735457.1 HK97 gp10 family phage protein [Rouxiella badensis]MCC3760754.1 HK97 gp10 family phage protein [Rouxiella badensis]
MIDTKLDFSGLLDISKDLEILSKAESRNVLRQATRAGAMVFRDEVAARAPRLTGKLARNVVVQSHRNRNGTAAAGVHIRGTNPRTGNSDNKMKAANKNNAFYWRFVEMGTSKTPAHPFVRPAYAAKEEEALNAAFARANQAIDEVLSK